MQKENLFRLSRNTLVQIVSTSQNRTISQQIDLLYEYSLNPVNWLAEGLHTNLKTGISTDNALLKQRQINFGSNKKKIAIPPGFFQLLWESLEDFTLRILIAASFVSIAIDVGTSTEEHRKIAWVQGFAIFMAVIISALVTTVNNYQKERQFLQMNQVADSRKRVTVFRDATQIQIHQDLILVGDIIILSQGMQIPADGYLIESNQITIDQSAMTGESQPISKDTIFKCKAKINEIQEQGAQKIQKYQIPSPIILSGTKILTGYGKMVVIVVGQLSCLGKLNQLATQKTKTQTPLQIKLEKLSKDISKFGITAAASIVFILLLRMMIVKLMFKNWNTSTDIVVILNYFILGITVIVVAIPEGLPLSVSLSLSVSVKKMLKDSNLVRRMQACQTMGGANMICSDKTGTLTMNQMILTTIFNLTRLKFQPNEDKIDLRKLFNSKFVELYNISSCINSTAILKPQKGSSTQIGILKFAQKTGVNYEGWREKYMEDKQVIRFPFNSKRKRMSTIIQYQNQKYIFVKGASQIILSNCNKWFNTITNAVQPLVESRINHIQSIIDQMATQTLRTICFAYKPLNSQNIQKKDEKGVFDVQKSDLIFLCIIGIRDIPRPEVPMAIIKCKKAGIRVRMVTGDNIKTANAIANQIGIIQNPDTTLIMQGADFMSRIQGIICKKCRTQICDCERDYRVAEEKNKNVRIDSVKNMDQFSKIIQNLDVLARSRPQDKYALVIGLKQLGNVVAVTGDGTNDAPALKTADIGFAMGISGTQVARSAAGIILLDDNFNSIVKAVLWGRNIYDSIKKFVQFQLTVNVVAVFITLIGAIIIQMEILRPIQMLWVNLIMDTLASLALATQPPSQELLQRKPHSRDQYILSPKMVKNILLQSIYQLTVMIIVTFAGELFIPQYIDNYDSSSNFQAIYKYNNGVVDGYVRSGRLYNPNGDPDYIDIFHATDIYSRHFTFVFNTFVMMQLFNFINARKIRDQLNVFSGILENTTFIIIILLILGLQILLVTFGSIAFCVYSDYGLTITQWLISIAIASISLIITFLGKFINQQKLFCRQSKKTVNLDSSTVIPIPSDHFY